MRQEIARQRDEYQQKIMRRKQEAKQKRDKQRREAAAKVEEARAQAKAEEMRRRAERAQHAALMRQEVTLRVLKIHGAVSTTPMEEPPTVSPAKGLEHAPIVRPYSASPSAPSWAAEALYTRSGLSKVWLTSARLVDRYSRSSSKRREKGGTTARSRLRAASRLPAPCSLVVSQLPRCLVRFGADKLVKRSYQGLISST